MEKILEATQEETRIAGEMAKQNQMLAKDMKNDSLAMKTVRFYLTIGARLLMCLKGRHRHDVLLAWSHICCKSS